jgi:hypothetical protein
MSFEKKYLKYKKKYLELQNTIQSDRSISISANIVPTDLELDRMRNMTSVIKQKVITWYNRKNVSELNTLINDCYEQLLDNSSDSGITSVKFPIYYLFDQLLNDDIGSNLGKYFTDNFNLEQLFSINKENLHYININQHSTIFYKFESNGRKYIYYSNSGLGINNQLYNNHTTACKIYYITDNHIFNNLSIYIDYIIKAVRVMNSIYDLEEDYDGKIKSDEIWIDLNLLVPTISSIFTKDEYVKLVKFNIQQSNTEGKHMTMCYILLNFFCKKYRLKMTECTINHVL